MTPLRDVPAQTSPLVVYGYFSPDDECLYVGQTQDLGWRHSQHHNSPYTREGNSLRILAECETRVDALNTERALIRQYDPPYNIKHSPSGRNWISDLIERSYEAMYPPEEAQACLERALANFPTYRRSA